MAGSSSTSSPTPGSSRLLRRISTLSTSFPFRERAYALACVPLSFLHAPVPAVPAAHADRAQSRYQYLPNYEAIWMHAFRALLMPVYRCRACHCHGTDGTDCTRRNADEACCMRRSRDRQPAAVTLDAVDATSVNRRKFDGVSRCRWCGRRRPACRRRRRGAEAA